MTKVNRHNMGFTLVEMMVTSVIGAFIAMVATGALHAVTSARERMDSNISVADEIRFAADIIRADVANLYRSEKFAQMKFVGELMDTGSEPVTSLTMKIVSAAKARTGYIEGDLYEVQYFLSKEFDRSSLMRRMCPVVGVETEDEETAGGILMTIAENILAFDITYFDGIEWLNEWPREQGYMPSLIGITIIAGNIDDIGKDVETIDRNSLVTKNLILNFPRLAADLLQPADQTQQEPEDQQQNEQQSQQQNPQSIQGSSSGASNRTGSSSRTGSGSRMGSGSRTRSGSRTGSSNRNR